MSLYATWIELCDEFDAHIAEFASFGASLTISGSGFVCSLGDECELEGRLSRVWQAWNNFCRTCIFQSCLGDTDGNGNAIAAHASAASAEHVSRAGIRAWRHQNPCWQGMNSILRAEPTWGDTNVLVHVIAALSPGNHGQLLAAVSSAHASAKCLQTIRNAAAHSNPQTLAEVANLQSAFLGFPLTVAVHALYWTEPTTQEFLVIHTLEQLRAAALAAIS